MAILKKRCPRCKREVKVLAVYSRSVHGNTVMRPIENQYQCSVCGICFKLRVPVVPVVLHNDMNELVTMSENEGKVR